MNHDLRTFCLLMLRAIAPALLVVAMTAFLTMPFALGHHPGEKNPDVPTSVRHMT